MSQPPWGQLTAPTGMLSTGRLMRDRFSRNRLPMSDQHWHTHAFRGSQTQCTGSLLPAAGFIAMLSFLQRFQGSTGAELLINSARWHQPWSLQRRLST